MKSASKSKIDVAIISPFFYPVFGGCTTFVDGLADYLINEKHRVTVLTPYSDNQKRRYKVEKTRPSSDRLLFLPALKILRQVHLSFTFAWSTAYIRKILMHKPNIVHTHGWLKYACIGSIIKENLKNRGIHTFHTYPVENTKNQYKKRIREFLSNIYLTTVCKDLAYRMEEAFGIRVDEVTHPGITPNFFRKPTPIKDKIIFLIISNFVWPLKAKGAMECINAYLEIKEQLSNSELWVVGKHVPSTFKEKVLKNTNNIKFLGSINHQEIPSFLEKAHIYLHYSYQEGLPNSLLEAMAAGKAIVATRTGGIPEVIENKKNGLLVNEGAKEELTEAMIAITEKKKYSAYSITAHETAFRFKWDLCGKRIISIYEKL